MAIFENVLGMWKRKNFSYIQNICRGLVELGYQFRTSVLRACDYGDPQKRTRFFIFATRKSLPHPVIPPKTHGEGYDLIPFVTVKDAISHLEHTDKQYPNMVGKTTSMQPGEHGLVRLDPNGLSPTIRCSKLIFHLTENRPITPREAASIQSFPPDYVFHGNLESQYRQIGNAIPGELAEAIARMARQFLAYEYEDIDGQCLI